ncbi:MAG: HAMP domain-containing protein [Rhodobacteraceae bacterium]|nr:HAMP domain-containing protein [Paracoccaceae bacterium]
MSWRWRRPDIRSRLWLALALLALSTLFVGGIGWYALDRADTRLQALHSRTLEEVARSLRLSKQSSDLATSAPYLLNLQSSYLIQKEGQALVDALGPVLAEWPTRESQQLLEVYAFDGEISLAVRRMQAAISDLVAAAQNLSVERDKTRTLNARLFVLENRFFQKMANESTSSINQRLWLALQTETNELVGAGHAASLVGVGERRRRFQQLRRDFSFLEASPPHLEWAQKLDSLAYGENGLFVVRRRELTHQVDSQNALFRIRHNASLISNLAAQFATNAEDFLSNERSATATSISYAKVLILGALLASIAIALIAALYVSGYVTRNIHAISDAMQRLAAGDRGTKLRLKVRDDDEIGKLHAAFRIFRANALRLDRSHRQLHQQNALFEKIFANISDGVAITDAQGQLTATNPHLADVLRPQDRLPEKPDIASFLAHTTFADEAKKAGLNAGFRGFTEIMGADGRTLEVRCSRLPDGGGIWLFADATERRKMDDRLRQIRHIESLGKVTGEVAHDFGNILAAVNSNVHLLQTGSKTVSAEVLLQRISNAVELGTSLTQRLLAFARQQALAPEVVELNELIEGLTELVSIGLNDEVTLETLPAKEPLFVRVDPGQLESAILNLCLNSNQAILGAGKISVAIKKASSETVQITVSDTGCGMEDAVLSQALEPFFTARADGEGTGLGLSMVYGFIKQTGGDIQISSQPGKGTDVRLTLPRFMGKAAQPELLHRALLVEDDPEALASVAAQLKSIGYHVVRAGTFEEGQAALDAKCRFDVLVTDLHLNEGQMGWALAEQCLDMCSNAKVIITSGRLPKRHRYTDAPHPRVACIAKPLSPELLQENM